MTEPTHDERDAVPARERINDKDWAAELRQRNQSCIDSAAREAYAAYRAVTDPTGMPAPHGAALNAALAAALTAVATAWREDATRWRTAGKRGGKGTADDLMQAASRVAGVAVGLTASTPAIVAERALGILHPTTRVAMMRSALGSAVCGSVDPMAPSEPACMRADVDHDGSCVNWTGRRWPRSAPPTVPAALAYLSGQTEIYDPPDAWPTVDGDDAGAGSSLLDPATATTDVIAQSDAGTATLPTQLQIFDPTSALDRVVSYADLLARPITDDQRPDRRSVSQLDTYTDCGMKYRLQRYHGDDAPQVPQWSLVGGTAFHAAVEQIERSYGVVTLTSDKLWPAVFEAATDATRVGTDVPLEQWRAAKKGLEGYDWWRVEGETMVANYLTWSAARHAAGWSIETIHVDLTPLIEWPFQIKIGDVRVDGIIDQVWFNRAGGFQIVDLKSGASMPTDTIQLAVYAQALAQHQVASEPAGAYYDARHGTLTPPVDIWAHHTPDELVYRFAQFDAAERAGYYQPRPSSFCGGCSVRRYCPAVSH